MSSKYSRACRRLSGAHVSRRTTGVRPVGHRRRRLDGDRCQPGRAGRQDPHTFPGAREVHRTDRGVAGGPGSSIGRRARREVTVRGCRQHSLETRSRSPSRSSTMCHSTLRRTHTHGRPRGTGTPDSARRALPRRFLVLSDAGIPLMRPPYLDSRHEEGARPSNWTRKNKPQAAGLGFHHGAGDENRTRALSLGSDGAWAGSVALTCADTVSLGGREGRFAPLLTVVSRSYVHAMGTATCTCGMLRECDG
jgi:hypothetical protein